MSLIVWLTTIPVLRQIVEFYKYLLVKALKTGHLPNHIAFIMDGNRRYAKQRNLPVQEGHNAGSETLASILELCYRLDIKAVSIYAFSIENFKRSKSEINYLMDLIQQKIAKLMENGDLVDKFGVRIIFSGNKSYLPKDVYDSFKEAEKRTEKNDNVILNVCFPYTSRDDITSSIRHIVHSVKHNNIDIGDINEDLVSNNLDTKYLPPLDFLIRTSGVNRLSDYLLWEVTGKGAEIELLDIYWPELNQILLSWSLFKWSFRKTSLNDFFNPDKIKYD